MTIHATAVELVNIAKHLGPTDKAIVEDAARRIGSPMNKPDNMEAREEAARLYEVVVKAQDARDDDAAQDLPEDEFKVLDASARAAEEAYEAHPLVLVTNYDGDEVLRCGACKAPLVDGDELLEDAHTGEMFLRSALGLPPRAKEEDGKMLPDMAEAT
jgi:hypothetical protein